MKKMTIFHFPQFEHELFFWYFKRLNAVLAQCVIVLGKWEILGIVAEGVNSETRILLQYWDFHGKNANEAWYLLEWVAGNSFEFEKASCVYGYLFHDPCAFMLNCTMLLFGVTCVIFLSIMLVHVLIVHAILILIRLYL